MQQDVCRHSMSAAAYLRAETLYCLPVLGSDTLNELTAFLQASTKHSVGTGAEVSLPFEHDPRDSLLRWKLARHHAHLVDTDTLSRAELVLDLRAALQYASECPLCRTR
jgi:hypothetical protein